VRCCGAGCGVPGKGWERIESRNGHRGHGGARRGLAAGGSGRALSVIPAIADRPLNWIGNAQARRLDSAARSARAANCGRKPSSGHPSRGAATHLSPDPLRMGRREAPLGRGRLPVRGRTGNFEPSATPYLRCVSRHGKSQLPDAPQGWGSLARYPVTPARALLFPPRIRANSERENKRPHSRFLETTQRTRNGGSLQDRLTMRIIVGVQRAGGEGLEIWW
jgi:hypothetical protein